MANDTKLQIPISKKIKAALMKKAEKSGFTSVNEVVRVLIYNYIYGSSELAMVDRQEAAIEFLDEETDKRITKALEDYECGDYDTLDYSKDKHALRTLLNEKGHIAD